MSFWARIREHGVDRQRGGWRLNWWPRLTEILLATANRGRVLDLFVFLLNLTVMSAATQALISAIRRAEGGDRGAEALLFGLCVALFLLAPLGATLKRWSIHHSRHPGLKPVEPVEGCLFSPILYFCLTAVICAAINAFVLQTVYGRKEPDAAVFIGSILFGIVLMIWHTVTVYRYFSPPTRPPRWSFLRSRAAANAGDVCFFVNMALFQAIWNLIAAMDIPRVTGAVDALFRLLGVFFLALLIYFPPRMFYLAQDIGRPRTWLWILLANLPMLWRIMVGSAGGGW